ncbi:MAG: hypothetical protein AAF456_03100 [Planctomycetota bacterium]
MKAEPVREDLNTAAATGPWSRDAAIHLQEQHTIPDVSRGTRDGTPWLPPSNRDYHHLGD